MRPPNLFLFLILTFYFVSGCISMQTPAAPGQSLESIGREEFEIAVKQYQQENYSQAVQSFMDLIQRYPGAPVLAEAQWMLAKSYEAQGKYPEALQEYQLFIKNYPGSEHLYEARLRADVLKRTVTLPPLPDSHKTIRAVQLSSLDLITGETAESTIQMLSDSGINALIVPVTQSADPLPGIFFNSEQAPVAQDLLGSAAALAHDYNMRVFAAVPLRDMPWIKDPKWLDLKFDPASQSFETGRLLNLWNPAVQNYILALYLDLAAYPLDGLIIEEPAGYSDSEAFNEAALEKFNSDFGFSLTPSGLYANGKSSPAFWRWAGWKNRQVMAMLGGLVHELHVKQPELKIGLAMSKEAVVLPKEALVKYGQDLLEANQASFDFFIFPWSPESRTGEHADILKRLKEFFPDREKIVLRTAPGKPLNSNDLSKITDFSLVLSGSPDSFEWIQELPPEWLSPRPSP